MKKTVKLLIAVIAVAIVAASLTACSLVAPEKKLAGTWLDSTGYHGYEFTEDGKVTLIAFDASKLSIVGTIIDGLLGSNIGDIEGLYTVTKGEDGLMHLKLTYGIGSNTYNSEYTYTINDTSLSLTNVSDGSTATYIKQAQAATTSAVQQ